MTVETDILDLGRRVNLLEAEIRVFTPPISQLHRELVSFRFDMTHRFEVDRRILSDLSDFRTETNARLSGIETRLSSLEHRMDGLEHSMEALEHRMGNVEKKLDRILDLLESQSKKDPEN